MDITIEKTKRKVFKIGHSKMLNAYFIRLGHLAITLWIN